MKKIFILLVCMLMFIPAVKAEDDLAPTAKSAVLIEASTGQILYQKEAHTKFAPASMTKIMSMLLFIEAIESGNLHWGEKIKVSEHAASMGGSQIFLEPGEVMTVTDLFKGIAIGSANDATVALAERVGGTEEHFIELMNQKVKALGLVDTNFKNASGLDEANHYSTAYDMATMGRELIKHKKILEFTSTYEAYLRENQPDKYWLVNTNKLVRFYSGVDGLKTGYTEEAGYCLTATAVRDNMRLIAVVFGEPDSKSRSADISKMLDYGYNVYSINNLLSTNNTIGKINIIKGKAKTVEIVPAEDLNILYKKGTTMKNVTYKTVINKNIAPLKKGDIIGKINIVEDNNVTRSVGVTVKYDVPKVGFVRLYLRYMGDVIKGL